MSMSGTPKEKTDQALIDAFLKKGEKVTKGKTKPMKHELGLSNNVWNNPLTKDEKKSSNYNHLPTIITESNAKEYPAPVPSQVN